MLTSSTLEAPLAPHWAFVVQLRDRIGQGHVVCVGG
jgi:hypothetical protein